MVASTQHHRTRLLKYYPRPPCAPSCVKSRMLRPLQTHFFLFQQIFFILACIHAGNPRVPPRVLASGLKTLRKEINCILYDFLWDSKGDKIKRKEMINEYNKGGLKMVDLQSFNQSLRAILRESEAKLEMRNYIPPSFFVWR